MKDWYGINVAEAQQSLAARVNNLYFQYGRTHAHKATDLLIGRRESEELDAYAEQYAHLVKSDMTKNDEQHFMGLRFVRTSALSQLVVGCFLVEGEPAPKAKPKIDKSLPPQWQIQARAWEQ